MDKPYEEAYQLIENMAQNHIQWGGERIPTEKPPLKRGMYEVNGIDHVKAKVDSLAQKTGSLTVTPTASVAVVTPNYELCGTPGNNTVECHLLAALYHESGKEAKKVENDDQQDESTDNMKRDKNKEVLDEERPHVPPPSYKPPIPYPQRLAKSKNGGQFKKFVDLLKQLNITIPFTEVVTQIPLYAKFLKEIISNNKKLEDNEIVTLTTECCAIIQNNMPPKLKDSGMLENVLVQIGQFYIPISFIIMDIKEDSNILIILGRPFLATAGAIIDVKKGKLTFEVGEQKVEFILSQFLKASTIDDSCCSLYIIDEYIREMELKPPKYIEILKILVPPILEYD
ncbi:uncharacterized protein LOC127094559 [Lathyrus oleraceus]|uniref:uncharacterized protein LOC127094559 n=1 Tax=Pisum sativum TaxID=3888 RepID=UPI0021CF3AB3|nr:uncharacterized protein LOC127094559 [Pisum sativum]